MNKNFLQIATLISCSAFSLSAFAKTHVIKFKVEKIGDVTHWEPEEVEVHPGEKVRFVIEDTMKAGPDFHGFEIKALKISKQVKMGEKVSVDTTIPPDMKPGSYDIDCQFHPKHAHAKLIVKDALNNPGESSPGEVRGGDNGGGAKK